MNCIYIYVANKLLLLLLLFQGSLNLEDFHTKALWLVKEAEYPEGAVWNRVLQDTIISGLASDKIRAKVIKEGKDVTLTRVMKIAHLKVSTQKHINWIQETKSQLHAIWERI